jgi:hypothetical protein
LAWKRGSGKKNPEDFQDGFEKRPVWKKDPFRRAFSRKIIQGGEKGES